MKAAAAERRADNGSPFLATTMTMRNIHSLRPGLR